MTKTIDKYFSDWERDAFGFGYGSGEIYVMQALKDMSELLEWNESGDDYTYDYRILEEKLGPTVAWLLINRLCRTDSIGYGSSPRFGFFYGKGKNLINFIKSHSAEELEEISTSRDGSVRNTCFGEYCSCTGVQIEQKCKFNPFWNDIEL